MFVDNLPGFGDNIRPSAGGGYWLGMAAVRSAEHYSPMDILGPLPAVRCLLGEVSVGGHVLGQLVHNNAPWR